MFIGVFFLLDAVQYIVELMLWDAYKFYIAHEFGPIRWISYAFSASLEMLCILWLCSIQDVFHSVYIVSLFFLLMMCGFYGEYYNQTIPYIHRRARYYSSDKITADEKIALNAPDRSKTSIPEYTLGIYFRTSATWFWFGMPMFLLAWIQTIAQLAVSADQLRDINLTLPWFVWTSVISLFVLQSTFAANYYLNLQKIGMWNSYIVTNRMYKLLSLVAKVLPGLIIHFGMMSIDCSTP